MNKNLPPNLDAALSQFYAAQEPETTFAANLEVQLRQHQIELLSSSQKSRPSFKNTGRSFMHTLRTRPIMAVITVILALLFLTGAAYAITRLAGFIPGIGFVKDVQSVLETPVVVQRQLISTPTSEPINAGNSSNTPIPLTTQNRDGITITVEQAVAEADRLVIAYKITGLPPDLFGSERAQVLSGEQEEEPLPEQVRLPDGTDLNRMGGGNCGGAGDLATSWLSCRIIFSPLPEGINEFTLEIHRLQNALPGELPEDWQIPIHLAPVSSSNSPSSVQEPDLRSQPIGGITLRLLKTSQDAAQTAFQLGMEWEGQDRMLHHTAPITLQDDQGRYYILSGGPDGGSYSSENPNFSTLPSLVTTPLDGNGPLTFRLDWIIMSATGRRASLHFNPAKDAKPGQEWVLDEKINVGGFDLHFTKARLKEGSDGSGTFEFDIEAPEGVVSINLFSNAESFSSESGYDKDRGILVSRITPSDLPDQPVEFNIAEVLYKVEGPWEITWQPKPVDFAAVSSVTPAPTRMAEPTTPTLVPDEPLLSDLQTLLKRAEAGNPQGPGWVHQLLEMNQTESVGILDTGDLPEQPLHSRVDAWYRLDENGYVRTTVYIRKTPDGKFLSADIDNGIYHFSFPEGRGGIGQDIYLAKPSYDLNLLSTLNGYIQEGGTIRQESIAVDGIPCQSYEATLPYDPPQIFTGEAAPVRAMIYSACVDPISGKVLQVQNQMEYTDGTSLIKGTTRFLSLEKVDILPEEVSQLLEKVIMP